MNTYLLPYGDSDGCWITSVTAKGITEAEEKFVNYLADIYDFIDYGSSFDEVQNVCWEKGVNVGDIYDIDDFDYKR